ncbi:hypothetical protein MASR2M29_07470 [Spirochaetota bacterium]
MFAFVKLEFYTGFWWIFPRLIAAGFIFLSGWNLAGKKAENPGFRAFAIRAIKLAIIATAISIATWPVLGKGFVFFGVLHLLAVASILGYPLPSKPVLALLIGAASLLLGLYIGQMRFDFFWLAWLGFRPVGLYPADYLPIIPWFAFFAFGIAGHDLGLQHKAPLKAKPVLKLPAFASGALWFLAFLGKHSLKIYLIHLPVLYAIGLIAYIVPGRLL